MTATVETRMKKSNFSFTARFVGLSGYPDNVGEYTSSPVVQLEDRSWVCRIYPGGYDEESRGFLSCFVEYQSKGTVRASYKITIINQLGWKNHSFSSEGVQQFPPAACGAKQFVSKADLKTSGGMCCDDTIIIKIDLTIYGELEKQIKSSCTQSTGSPLKPRSVTQELSDMLFSTTDSDISIITKDGEIIPAHKFILSLRSEVFRAMFHGPMIESSSNEVRIDDIDGGIIRHLLRFMYTDDCDINALETNAEFILAGACKYQIKGLETICENHLCSIISVDNAASLLTLSDTFGANHLKNKCLQFISQNSKSVLQSGGFFDNLNVSLYQDIMKAIAGLDIEKNVIWK